MQTFVASLRRENAAVVLNVDQAADEDIKNFVGPNHFYSDGDANYVCYHRNGIGLIARLRKGDYIVKRNGAIAEVCNRDTFAEKYIGHYEIE